MRRLGVAVGLLVLLTVSFAFSTQCPCLEYINWDEAKNHVGESLWVRGPVVNVGRDNQGDVFLNLGCPFPQHCRFTVVIWKRYVPAFQDAFPGFPDELEGNNIYIFGKIGIFQRDGNTEIELGSPRRLVLEDSWEERVRECNPHTETGEVSIEVWGAAGEVGGSCYLVWVGDKDVLVDCGSFFSRDPTTEPTHHEDADPFCFYPSEVDALLVTHAHDDHVGRIHYLVYDGFKGPIYMTEASAAIYEAKLDDLVDFCRTIPNYSARNDVKATILYSIQRVAYNEPIPITDHITATFVNAGHIPGSASIVLTVSINGMQRTITFSGDIGSGHHPFLKDPDLDFLSTTDTDILVIESTYGASGRREYPDEPYAELWAAIRESRDRYGKNGLVIIPAFALDRTQCLLAAIREGIGLGELPADLKVAIGGKSSCYLTRVYAEEFQAHRETYEPYFSSTFWNEAPLGVVFWDYLRGPNCSVKSGEDVDRVKDYDVIIAPSGTGESSFAKELLKTYLNDSSVTIVKVGWAPSHSPMGRIGSGAQSVVIDGKSIPVRARIVNCGHFFSGHADITMLLQFVEAFGNLKTVVITHGEDAIGARQALAETIKEEHWPSVPVVLPSYGDSLPLLEGVPVAEPQG